MRRAPLFAGVVGLALAVLAPTAPGAVVARTKDAQWPPLIDGDEVVWVQRQQDGDLLVRRAAPGSPPTKVLRAELPDVPFAIQAPQRLAVGAAGTALGRTVQIHRQHSEELSDGAHLFDELVLAPRAGDPQMVARSDGDCPAPHDVAVSDVLVIAAYDCGSPQRATVRLGDRVLDGPTRLVLSDVRAAGRFIAWRRFAMLVGTGPDEIVVFDRVADRVAYLADLRPLRSADESYDLDADGAIAVAYETRPVGERATTRLGLAVADARNPRLRAPRGLKPAAVEIAADGGRIAFIREGRNGDAQAVVATRDGRVLAVRRLAPRRIAQRVEARRTPTPFVLSLLMGLDLQGDMLAATVGRRQVQYWPWLRARDSRVLAWKL